MASRKSNTNVLLWIIGVIAILAFIGVIYLLISDRNQNSVETVLVGNAVEGPINPLGNPGTEPLDDCNRAADDKCESNHGAGCRRQGQFGAQCAAVHDYGSYVLIECECYQAA